MKRLIFILMVLFTMFSIAGDKEPQKFKVTFTVTFNELTLEQASKKEMVIKELLKDACDINVKIENSDNLVIISGRGLVQPRWGLSCDSTASYSIPIGKH